MDDEDAAGMSVFLGDLLDAVGLQSIELSRVSVLLRGVSLNIPALTDVGLKNARRRASGAREASGLYTAPGKTCVPIYIYIYILPSGDLSSPCLDGLG